jgi:hypothetical protein
MLAEDPAKRLGGYPELLARMEQLGVSRQGASTPATPAISSPALPEPRPRWGKRALLAGIPALVGLALVLTLAWHNRTPESEPLSAPQALTSIDSRPLYDGESINGWRVLKGFWSPARDAEKGAVLSGRGAILRPLIPPPSADYRLTLGLDLKSATAVELHFALHEPANDEQARFVVRVARDGVFLGTVERDGGTPQPASDVLPFPAKDDPDDVTDYRELKVERQGSTWWAFFEGRLIGGLKSLPGLEIPEFRLVTEGGPAFFESIELADLAPAGT